MAYVALYRAYRPQKFSDVVVQQHIIKTLQNAIKLNKVAHAYLFCGPRGTGKTTLAKILAKSLNCEHGPTVSPCCTCEICEGIQKGMISDVVEIDAASNNGADDIRALRDTVKYLPATAKYKVCLAGEAVGESRAVQRPATCFLLGFPHALSGSGCFHLPFLWSVMSLDSCWTSVAEDAVDGCVSGSDLAGIGAGSRRVSAGAGPHLLFPRSPSCRRCHRP